MEIAQCCYVKEDGVHILAIKHGEELVEFNHQEECVCGGGGGMCVSYNHKRYCWRLKVLEFNRKEIVLFTLGIGGSGGWNVCILQAQKILLEA